MTLTLGIRTVVAIVVVSESGLFTRSNLGSSGSMNSEVLDCAGVTGDLDCQGFGVGNSVTDAVMVSSDFVSDGL